MPLYDVLGIETLPAAWIDIHFATFETCGKGFFITPIVTWDGVSRSVESIFYQSLSKLGFHGGGHRIFKRAVPH